jgi:hypothetical protein
MSMRHTQSRAALARDAALERIRRTRRWVIVGSAALTAGFAALVSAVAPGRSLAAKSQPQTEASTATASSGSSGASTSSSGSSSAIPRMPPPANPSSLGLQGPNDAPAPAPQQSQPQSDPSQSQPQSDPSQSQSAPPPPPPPVVSSGGS